MNENNIEPNNNTNNGGIPPLNSAPAQPVPATEGTPNPIAPAEAPALAEPTAPAEAPAEPATPIEAPVETPAEPATPATPAEPVSPIEPAPQANPVAPAEPQEAPSSDQVTPEKNNKGLLIGLIATLVVLAVAGVVIFFIIKPFGNSDPNPTPSQKDESSNTTKPDEEEEEEPEEEEEDDDDETDSLETAFEEAEAIIADTEGQKTKIVLIDLANAYMTKMLYHLKNGEIDEVTAVLPKLKQTASDLKSVTEGEYDTTNIDTIITSIESIKESLNDPETRELIIDALKNASSTVD